MESVGMGRRRGYGSRRSARLVWTVEGENQKMKFQIQRGLGARPENSKEGDYTPGLTEWLVSTLLVVRAEEYSDGRVRRSP